MFITEPVLTLILCLTFLRGTSAGCDLPDSRFVEDLSLDSAGSLHNSGDTTELENYNISCTSVDKNNVFSYSSVYLSLIVDITGQGDDYYARC